jgi:hypothetical protein
MRKLLLGLVTTTVMSLGLLAGPAVTAEAVAARQAPFAREAVARGDVDHSPYDIAHVWELQQRLKWAGVFRATPNGIFGPVTEAAVKAFQRRVGVRATGVATYATWKPLISRTVRGRAAVPAGCRSSGWHACYDRWRHQLNLYANGSLVNSWLVRGGGASTPTRVGRFPVTYRDLDHVSGIFGSPMPYSQFFSGGQAIHGSRNMMNAFAGHSHGCVNMYVEDARQLWRLTSGKNLVVHVYGGWS